MSEKVIAFKDAVTEALAEELAREPRLVVIGDEIRAGPAQTIDDLAGKFPGRVITRMPLAEEMLCGIGLGIHLGGLKPVVQFNHSAFLLLAFYELYKLGTWRYRMAEKSGPGIVIRTAHLGGRYPATELDAALFSAFFHLPNIWIAAPSFPYYAKGLFKAAVRADRPVLFIEDKVPEIYFREEAIPVHDYEVPFPKAALCRSGGDITIVSWQYPTFLALQASEELQKKGIDVEVLSLQTLQPLDMETIVASAKKTGRVLVVEEDPLRGGIGAEISAQIGELLPQCRVRRLASKNMPRYCEPPGAEPILPNVSAILKACEALAATKI